VKLRDPGSRELRLFPPGGRVEADESPASAAARETLEETGYVVTVDPASEIVARYPFVWNGQQVDVTTHFFRARLATAAPPLAVHDASYHEGVVWLPWSHVRATLGYDENILRAVLSLR
jgi:tRNA(adenine34) deaminase